MLKYILIIFFTILLTACSNLNVKPITENDKILLSNELESFRYYLKNGEIEKIKPFLSNNLQKGYVIKRLENTEFNDIEVFYSPPSFTENIANNIIALSSKGKTLYFEIEYIFLNNRWEITTIRQKGD